MGCTDIERKDPDVIIRKLDSYFVPQSNISITRNNFNSRVQREGESFDMFLNDLRKIANQCDFGELKDELIRDRIVCAVRDPRVKDRLLRDAGLTLQRTIDICKAAEQTSQDIAVLTGTTVKTTQVYDVSKERYTHRYSL